MPQSFRLVAASLLALVFCAPGRGQDSPAPSPSLGDIARQAQKNKADRAAAAGKPAAKVFTNDDMSSSSSGGAAALGAGFGQIAPSSAGKPDASLSPAEKLAALETVLDKLATVDRATLVRNVLSGKDVDFPGRARWEDRLFSAKETYVAQGRALMQKARGIVASAESLKGIQDQNDPRVKEVAARLQSLIRDAVAMDSSFQAVMMEGRDLASQASLH